MFLFYIIGNKKALLHIPIFSYFLVPFIVCFQHSHFMIVVELCLLSLDLVNEITW